MNGIGLFCLRYPGLQASQSYQASQLRSNTAIPVTSPNTILCACAATALDERGGIAFPFCSSPPKERIAIGMNEMDAVEPQGVASRSSRAGGRAQTTRIDVLCA
jgi:hypothetical protein